MKVIADLNYREALFILNCIRMGSILLGVVGEHTRGYNRNLIEDMEDVVGRMGELDPTMGSTGPAAPAQRKSRIRLEAET